MVCARSTQYRAFRCSVVFRLVGLVFGFACGWAIPRGVGLPLSIQRSGASLGLSLTERLPEHFKTALALFEIREQPVVRTPLSCMCMFKAIRNPDFDHRLPGNAEAFSLSVK